MLGLAQAPLVSLQSSSKSDPGNAWYQPVGTVIVVSKALINPHLLRRTKTSAGIMGDGRGTPGDLRSYPGAPSMNFPFAVVTTSFRITKRCWHLGEIDASGEDIEMEAMSQPHCLVAEVEAFGRGLFKSGGLLARHDLLWVVDVVGGYLRGRSHLTFSSVATSELSPLVSRRVFRWSGVDPCQGCRRSWSFRVFEVSNRKI